MKIMATLDLAATTPAVLREARTWALRMQAELFLIHVTEPDPDFVGYGAGPESVRLAVAHRFTQAHKQIEDAAAELRQDGIETTALLLQGSTAESILREADHLSVDAILMGTRAHGALREILMGSVSKSVLQKSTRPILLIPPHDTP